MPCLPRADGKTQNNRAAFSLVELSIVLVILGLLTGGILGGQSLIKAAELRAVTTELERWQTATNTFSMQYRAFPGDFKDATRFWGAATCPPTAGAAPLDGGTCDGDGNGRVGDSTTQRFEAFLFWHHLSLSGVVPGQFTGVPGDDGISHHVIGENAPPSKYSSGGWSIFYVSGGSTNQYDLEYGNAFVFGANRSPYATNGKLLTPEEAWSIDTKMDDGLPASGMVIAHWLINECAAADNGSHTNDNLEASYRLEDSSVQCSLLFREIY